MAVKKLEKPSIDEIIERGGEVYSDKNLEKKEWINFTLRIRKDLLKKIDDALESRVGISKTGWILEAIQDKLREHSL